MSRETTQTSNHEPPNPMISLRRLSANFLLEPVSADPAEIVRRLGAVQAQDFSGAKWGLALRGSGITDAVAERAFAKGRILRTHVMRPTWHFVAAADIRWLLALTAPRVHAGSAGRYRELGIDRSVIRRSNSVMTRALRDGKQLTRAELGEELERARIDTTMPQRLVYLLAAAELDGVICSGARRGKQLTYALLEERVAPAKLLDREEALLELARRYFTTRGPATPQDFAWWSGLTVADAKRGIAAAGDSLEQLTIDGGSYWSGAVSAPAEVASPTAHLLPNYDEYFIGYKDRSAILRKVQRSKMFEGGVGLAAHVLLIDGQVAGVWKRSLSTTSVTVAFQPVVRLTRAQQRAVEKEARRYGRFLELPVEFQHQPAPERR